MKAGVLSTVYGIKYVLSLNGRGGETDSYAKEIRINRQEGIPAEYEADNLKRAQGYTLRHELMHTFLFESGVDQSGAAYEAWTVNEEMTDWMVIQVPKIMATHESMTNKNVIRSRYIDGIKSTEVGL